MPRLPARSCASTAIRYVPAGASRPSIRPSHWPRRLVTFGSSSTTSRGSSPSVRQTEKTRLPCRPRHLRPSRRCGPCRRSRSAAVPERPTASIFGRGGVRSSLMSCGSVVGPAFRPQPDAHAGTCPPVRRGPRPSGRPTRTTARPRRGTRSSRCARTVPPSSSRIVTVTSSASGSLKRICALSLTPSPLGEKASVLAR